MSGKGSARTTSVGTLSCAPGLGLRAAGAVVGHRTSSRRLQEEFTNAEPLPVHRYRFIALSVLTQPGGTELWFSTRTPNGAKTVLSTDLEALSFGDPTCTGKRTKERQGQ